MNGQLTFTRVSFTHETLSSPLFDGLSAVFPPGWTALAGVNGAGKTTLLSLAAGRLVAESGSITGAGFGERPAVYLAQDMETPPDFFADPSLVADTESLAIIARLGIGDDWPWRWDSLSGGERRRALVADALLKRPELLILDEPTNHLDASALALIASALGGFRGTGIAVSHNIGFLDSLCARTLILKRTGRGVVARAYDCPPSQAFDADRAEDERLRSARTVLSSEIERLGAMRSEAAAEVARGKKRLSKRDLDPKDHDGKGRIDAARVTGKDAASGAKEARLAARMARGAAALAALESPGLRKTGASLSGVRTRADSLFRLPGGTLTVAGGNLSIRHPELALGGADRVALTGDNGAGKTSFLLALLGRLAAGNIAYIPQEYDREGRARLLARLRALDAREKADAISIVYRLGSEPSSLLEAEVASPGETKKLSFALAMTEATSCLVLDEPTNHLDALSASLLAEALAGYQGAILMATHDRAFMGLVGCAEWRLERKGNESVLEAGR